MGLVVANRTYSSAASLAFANLSATVNRDVAWLDPFATVLPNTIDPVLGFVFLELAIPILLEFHVEELVYMFQVDMIVRATTWGHVRWIGD